MSVLFGFVFVWFVLVRLSMSELLLLGMLMSSDIGRNRRVVSIFVLFVVNVNHFSVENSQFCVCPCLNTSLLGMLMSPDIGRNRCVVSIFVLLVVNVNHVSVENSQFCVCPCLDIFLLAMLMSPDIGRNRRFVSFTIAINCYYYHYFSAISKKINRFHSRIKDLSSRYL